MGPRVLLLAVCAAAATPYDVPAESSESPFFVWRLYAWSDVKDLLAVRRPRDVEWRPPNGKRSNHGFVVPNGTEVADLEIASPAGFKFLTNIPKTFFKPDATVTLTRCLQPETNGDPKKLSKCLPRGETERHPRPCIYGEDEFQPGLFQHAMIDSVPALGLARLVRRHLAPGAQIVIPGNHQRQWSFLRGDDVVAPEASTCGTVKGSSSREWLIIGQGMERDVSSNDCFPIGSYDWFRREHAAKVPGTTLLYASREGGGGRGPVPADAAKLETFLKETAKSLGLAYVKTVFRTNKNDMRSAFERARVVVAPHGGAITNIVYAHASTIVVEVGYAGSTPGLDARYCFACMAIAMRFPYYATFDAGERWAFYRKRWDSPLDVDEFKRFWSAKVRPAYDDVAATLKSNRTSF